LTQVYPDVGANW